MILIHGVRIWTTCVENLRDCQELNADNNNNSDQSMFNVMCVDLVESR